MDFSRGSRPSQHPAGGTQPAAAPAPASKKRRRGLGFLQLSTTVLLGCLTVLVVALAIYAFTAKSTNNSQSQYVDTGKMQAVFLNGGQVYFGKITGVNSQYMTLNNIYYLRVNQQVQPGKQSNNNDISLVKLGCELHGPQDQMVINQSQVVFWENLKSDGQVAKAVDQFVKQNPNGLNCNQQTNNSTNSSNKQ